ncbi:unnamed protein product [Ambrosiozyma monospora]|uniref:Unnamed protein product n=1 Tax=Ambrosiozyma monospora TaxID=43982 RepID=A0ACB5T5P6_AMBMO|nr:unnamed protein product [Ambrosiozyma monospora]
MSDTYPSIKRTAVFKTKLPPCSLRMNQHDNTYIYLGTYKLVKGEERHGSIEVYRDESQQENQDDNELSIELGAKITKLADYPTDGAILDLKFDPFDSLKMVSVHSTGNLIYWQIDEHDFSKLTQLCNLQLFEDSTLITAVNFHKLQRNLITVTTTAGQCCTFTLPPSGSFSSTKASMEVQDEVEEQTQHDLECWYADFGSQPNLENVVFSGGDDRKLISADIRSPHPTNIFSKTDRVHDAGIVSILTSSEKWCSNNPYALWTGSYDDHVKSLDLRFVPLFNGVPPPRVKNSVCLGGGVWKLIPDPDHGSRLLSCCMYDGARILDASVDDGDSDGKVGDSIKVINYFKGDHESMCYGGDWVDGKIVTCSFYDNVVQIWKP